MIRLEDLSKSFDQGKTRAVENLTLDVPPGEISALIGESGCGKTTTLKMINRLIEPTRGRVLIEGRDVRVLDPVILRRRIGYVFQGIGLFPHWDVFRNIAAVPRLLQWKEPQIRRRVDEMLELVGLPPATYRSRPVRELSGGQQQRIGVARALAGDPELVLMDEPFGALDPLTRDDLRNEFRQLQRRLGISVILVTHDMTEALLLGDHVAVMREGKLIQFGTPAELIANPQDRYVETLLSHPAGEARRLGALWSGSPAASREGGAG